MSDRIAKWTAVGFATVGFAGVVAVIVVSAVVSRSNAQSIRDFQARNLRESSRESAPLSEAVVNDFATLRGTAAPPEASAFPIGSKCLCQGEMTTYAGTLKSLTDEWVVVSGLQGDNWIPRGRVQSLFFEHKDSAQRVREAFEVEREELEERLED